MWFLFSLRAPQESTAVKTERLGNTTRESRRKERERERKRERERERSESCLPSSKSCGFFSIENISFR